MSTSKFDDLIAVYKDDLGREFQKLTAEEQAELAREGAYDRLVMSTLPLVLHVLRDVMKGGEFDVDPDIRLDLLQAGNIALMVAVKSWNPDAEDGMALSTWVCKGIRRDMLREFAKQRQVVSQVFEEQTYGISPDFEALVTLDGNELRDIDTPQLLVFEEDMGDELERERGTELAHRLLASLTERQREVIELTELQDLSLREAAAILGISYQTVANIRNSALERMRSVAACDRSKFDRHKYYTEI